MVAEFACLQCRTPFVNDFPLRPDGICALCRLGLTEYAGAWSYGLFEGPLARLIHLFKYQKISTLDRPLAGLLLRGLPPNLRFDVAVPVPLFWWKRMQRGFNQSELLARELSRRSGIPFGDFLRRTRHTPSQTGLSATARRQNVAGAFAVKPGTVLKGQRVLLIDDVLTTGATLAAASRALKQAGAARVTVLTLARTDRRVTFAPASHFQTLAAVSGAT